MDFNYFDVNLFLGNTYKIRHQIVAQLNGQKKVLINDIKQNVKSETDIFIVDTMQYIYLDTNTFPKKGRFHHVSDWMWDFHGKRPETLDKLWKELLNNPPSVVIKEHLTLEEYKGHKQYFDKLLSKYYLFGRYKTVGSLVKWPYGYNNNGNIKLPIKSSNLHGDVDLYLLKNKYK